MIYKTFFVFLMVLVLPFQTFAVTPDVISATVNPGVTIAILEGSVDPNGTTTTAWFEYGTIETLNNYKETVHLHIGSSSYPTPVKANLTGLMPNTTYYFRLATDNGQNTVKGKTLSFKTMKDEYVTGKNAENDNSNEDTYAGKKDFEITTKENNVSIGGEVNFLVTFKNKTERIFENTKVTVELPKGISYLESNFGEENNGTVLLNVENLLPEQVGSLSIKGRVLNEAKEKDLIITTALLSYKVSGSNKQEEKIDYVTNKIIPIDSNLAASSNLANDSFLPNTLIDWLTLILVIAGLILVGKNIYRDIPLQRERIKTLD
jgi:hypothetical protein